MERKKERTEWHRTDAQKKTVEKACYQEGERSKVHEKEDMQNADKNAAETQPRNRGQRETLPTYCRGGSGQVKWG